MKSVILTLRFLWLETQRALWGRKVLFAGYFCWMFADSFVLSFFPPELRIFLALALALLFWTGYHQRIYRRVNFPSVFQLPMSSFQRFIVYLVLPVTLSLGFLLLYAMVLDLGDGFRFLFLGREYSSQVDEFLSRLDSGLRRGFWGQIFVFCFLYHSLFGAAGGVVLYCRRFYLLGLLGLGTLFSILIHFMSSRIFLFFNLSTMDRLYFLFILDLMAWTLYFFGLKRTRVY